MVNADDVIHLYEQLSSQGIYICLTGGWGIDALLSKQTRPHKDLDIIMLVDDVNRMNILLGKQGYELKELWSENLWTVDSYGNPAATAYVLRDAGGRELDVHAIRLDALGNGLPAWHIKEGFLFSPQDLSGSGSVRGFSVRCQSAENQMTSHTGYLLPDYQWADLKKLSEEYKIDYPSEILEQLRDQRQR